MAAQDVGGYSSRWYFAAESFNHDTSNVTPFSVTIAKVQFGLRLN